MKTTISRSRWFFIVGSVMIGLIGQPGYAKENATKLRVHATKVVTESSNTIIAPVLTQELTPDQNVLWCATLQLAWNELDALAGGPVKMENESPLVAALNQQPVTKDDLDDASYVALAGFVGQELFAKIEKAQQAKFGDRKLTKDVRSLPQGSLVAYAALLKTLPFEWALTRFKTPLFYGKTKVAAFGVRQYAPGQSNDDKVAKQVNVLDYHDEKDFILELSTQAKADRLILAKVTPGATLAATVGEVLTRINQAKPTGLQKLESVMIPVINFDLVKNYPELAGHKLIAQNSEMTGKQFSLVTQRTSFALDERGATLKSKTIFLSALPPRRFMFNAPFLVMLIRQDAKNPYFALWVANAELLAPFQK